jgi:type I restriction-modification system DNA methylase subunit
VSTRKSQPSDFRKILESISRKHDTRKVFDAFVRFAACALAAQTREAEYLEEVKHWEKLDLDLFGSALGALVLEMEGRPFEDVLGGYYMEFALSHKGQQWNGEFHTPKHVCDLMAQMILGDVESLPREGPITVCEPACGAGAMILSLGETCPPDVRRRLRVTAIDINRTACDMAFVNTTLWGVPTRVIHGNSLSLECWAAWSNIHWIMPWLSLVPMHPVSAMMPPGPRTDIGQGEPPTPDEVERIRVSLHQPEFLFG